MNHNYKKCRKLTIILLLVIIYAQNSTAQDFKLGGINYSHYPKSAIKDISRNQETSFQEFSAFVNIPKKFKNNKTALISGIGYGNVEATMYNFPTLESNEYKKNIQVLYYQLSLAHKWNEKWSLLVNLKPTLASDFEQKLSLDDFVFQGAAIATRNVNDKFKFGAGLVNSTRWGRPILLPFVNMHYKYHRHNLNALLPMNIKYTYSLLPEENLKLGVKYARNGANFNIYASNITDIDKINYSRANIGVLANYQLTKILRLDAYGGISAGRIYRAVDFDENVYKFDSKTTPFFSVGIVLVSPKKINVKRGDS